ncbi:hypothetical protein E2C01_071149 [Portunus trituberculatus]|uniref:Uncharacterized protein n=1 Tax=Portunus trituberculatus TaxID=210409 RepID=A0A5B7I390_PORTR|nr:hypothetical protein [Portunus trituberculatus]
MNGKLALWLVFCLGAVVAVQGMHFSGAGSLSGVELADVGSVFHKTEIAACAGNEWEDALGPSSKQKYNYTTWMKRNTGSFLRNLGSDHPVEVEGSKVCLFFIPVGTNCSPVVGLIAEKDVGRLRKLGSQFVPQKETISNDSFMIGARIEGWDRELDAMFFRPPSPSDSEAALSNPKLREVMSRTQKKEKYMQKDAEVSFHMKTFGNEIYYRHLHGIQEVMQALGTLNPAERIRRLNMGEVSE